MLVTRVPGTSVADRVARAETTPEAGSGNSNRSNDTLCNRGENRTQDWFEVATELCGVDDGLPAELDGFKLSKSRHRVERLKALGNSIVPQVAIEIFKGIKNGYEH